jgi:hypothetical protein
MMAKPSECHAFTRQARAGTTLPGTARQGKCAPHASAGEREPNIYKASFTERRLFYLNHHRHCEEGAFPDEAISATVWGIASRTPALAGGARENESALAMTNYKGMQ